MSAFRYVAYLCAWKVTSTVASQMETCSQCNFDDCDNWRDPSPTDDLQDVPSASLLQVGMKVFSSARDSLPRDADWFQVFSEGPAESTKDAEALYSPTNPELRALEGWDPADHSLVDGTYHQGFRDVEDNLRYSGRWFDESLSAADHQAWQTHYPALKSGLNDHGRKNKGVWYKNGGGTWVEQYNMPKYHERVKGVHAASWFDNSVNQFDGYGRPMAPHPGYGQHYVGDFLDGLGWIERSVNTTLECAEPGCQADAGLIVYDPQTEHAENCRLALWVHPTDFEETWSNEQLFFSANGVQLNHHCVVRTDEWFGPGCNQEENRPLFPCINSIFVDHLMNNGVLNLKGNISIMVDECPYLGNLLSAVATVTCEINELSTTTTTTALTSSIPSQSVVEVPIRCEGVGCQAEAVLFFNAENITTCSLSMNFTNTDYDQSVSGGEAEVIEEILVGSTSILENYSPGQNPCLSEFQGTPLSDEERVVNVVNEVDVTQEVLNASPGPGVLHIYARNSIAVDECAYDGFLLYGFARLTCGHSAA